jgi:hypothetical protein
MVNQIADRSDSWQHVGARDASPPRISFSGTGGAPDLGDYVVDRDRPVECLEEREVGLLGPIRCRSDVVSLLGLVIAAHHEVELNAVTGVLVRHVRMISRPRWRSVGMGGRG